MKKKDTNIFRVGLFIGGVKPCKNIVRKKGNTYIPSISTKQFTYGQTYEPSSYSWN